jgi:hypothetical protein
MPYSLDGRAAQQALPPDAALRPKIAGILKSDLGSIIFPIYHCGAGEAQCVGRQAITHQLVRNQYQLHSEHAMAQKSREPLKSGSRDTALSLYSCWAIASADYL